MIRLELNEDEKNETDSTLFSGWVWIYKRMLSQDTFPDGKTRVMIFSPYLDALRDTYFANGKHKEQQTKKEQLVKLGKLRLVQKEYGKDHSKRIIEVIKTWR